MKGAPSPPEPLLTPAPYTFLMSTLGLHLQCLGRCHSILRTKQGYAGKPGQQEGLDLGQLIWVRKQMVGPETALPVFESWSPSPGQHSGGSAKGWAEQE